MRRSAWALLAGASALLLVVGLSLLLSRLPVLAQPAADVVALTVEKTVNTDVAAPGDTLTYTIRIQETESPVTLWMTDTLPAEVTYVDNSLDVFGPGNASYADGVVTWSAASLSFGQTALITFSAEISSEITYAEVQNTAQVAGTGQLVEDSATTTVAIAAGDLDNSGTYKHVSTHRAEPGDVLTYTVRLYNDSEDSVPSPRLTDVLHPALTCVPGSWSATLGDIDCVGGEITWTRYEVSAYQEVFLYYSAEISSGYTGVITNAARIVGSGQPFTRSVETRVYEYSPFTYLPFFFRDYPPAPVLNSIPEPDDDNSYTVSWSPVSVPIDRYVLQESTDADFDDVTGEWQTTGTSQFIQQDSTASGTFYYRVRADDYDQWGQGPWSNVESATIWGYSDKFSDYQSGWPREWSRTRGALYQVHPYEHPNCPGSSCPYDDGDGYVIARRSGSNPRARFGPDVAVPSENYEIELKSRWWDANYFATYQILFGADSSFDNYYAVEVRINTAGDRRDCEYRVVRRTSTQTSIASIESTKELQGWTSVEMHCGLRSEHSSANWNRWKIRREGSEIKIWLNDDRLGTWQDSKFGANRYFGVGCTLFEGFTPSKPEFDNWSVVLR
jgi:uncharacterized repeat protein (TIGR01451 family)